jgi:hypothetical protein
MDDQQKKPGLPFWLTVGLTGLLLVSIAVISENWVFTRFQRQRALDAQVRGQEVRDRLIQEGKKLHEQSLERKREDDSAEP